MQAETTLATLGAGSIDATIGHEFLAFKLGNEEYGVDIHCVQEIRSYEKPTRMVNMPDCILGVLNLRGLIVPVVDMRIKFGTNEVVYDHFTVVIVLTLGRQLVGMVVDAVSDVVALKSEQLRPVPEFSGAVGPESIRAIGSIGNRMLIMLAIEQVLGAHLPAIAGFAANPLQH